MVSMEVRILFLLTAFIQWKLTLSVTTMISGVISEDMPFIHKTFPVPPSERAIIEVDLLVKSRSIRKLRRYPMIGIYTTQDHINIRKQCVYRPYGQLLNRDLHPKLTMNQNRSAPLTCELVYNNRHLLCQGNITVQDYFPRKFSFSFGFHCRRMSSLRGLKYDIKIHVSNETSCLELSPSLICYPYIQYGARPNLLGNEMLIKFIFSKLLNSGSSCFQHGAEFLCYVFTNKCDPQSNQIIPQCREMCYNYLDACGPLLGKWKSINCDYLPSLYEEIPCFYKPVRCKEPPIVKNATVVSYFTSSGKYLLHHQAEYTCHQGFKMEGNKTITCLYNRHWSSPPQCSFEDSFLSYSQQEIKQTTEPTATPKIKVIADSRITSISISAVQLLVVVLLLVLLVMAFVTVIVVYKVEQKKSRNFHLKVDEPDTELTDMANTKRQDSEGLIDADLPLKRKREFDATIFYHFDTDDNFVLNHLLPELEEARDFKLFIHSRNFVPGRDIKDNIEEAIEGSNSAILLMSQGFVDSMWCKEEFTHCYIENMKDAAFSLFVIMMQPADTLVNISPYMKTFIANKTYLQVGDPELFIKLSVHLEDARQPEDRDVDIDSNENSWELREC